MPHNLPKGNKTEKKQEQVPLGKKARQPMKLYRTERTLACLSRKIKCSGEHDIKKKANGKIKKSVLSILPKFW